MQCEMNYIIKYLYQTKDTLPIKYCKIFMLFFCSTFFSSKAAIYLTQSLLPYSQSQLSYDLYELCNIVFPYFQNDTGTNYYKEIPLSEILAVDTGKSLSEALIFASTNPQHGNRLFIELQVQYMKIPSSNLGRTCCVQKFFLPFLYTTCSPHVLQKEELLTKIYLYS